MKQHKQKEAEKSAGFGIAINVQAIKTDPDPKNEAVTNWLGAMVEILQAVQGANDKKMDHFITVTMNILKKITDVLLTNRGVGNPDRNNGGGCCNLGPQCPYFKGHHPKVMEAQCWELETNAAS